MPRRPSLDQLFARALAAVADTKSAPTAQNAERLMRADREFLLRCAFTKAHGTTRGKQPRSSVFAEKIRTDPKDFADYLAEEIYIPEVLIRCKAFEKSTYRQATQERALSRALGDALNLEDYTFKGRAHLERMLRGKDVVLYHGTTSKFIPQIRKEGLRVGQNLVEHQPTKAVFLTIQRSGMPSAESYAERAVRKYGGRPVILTVVVPFDELAFDSDDEDLKSGSFQFETDSVSAREIVAMNDKIFRR